MDAISFGWRVVTKRFSTVALPIAVGIVAYAIPIYAFSFGGQFGVRLLAEQGVIDPTFAPFATISASTLSMIVSLLVASFMYGGIWGTALKAARGQPTTFGDPFSGGRFFVPFLVALVVAFIGTAVGFALCIVPGVILALGISLHSFLIVDQGMSGVDALKQSWEMTKGQRVNILLFGIISWFVYLAGVLACGLGALLISAPLILVAFAWIYLRIKGEPVVEPT